MAIYKQLYLAYMDQKGIRYTDRDDRTVRVVYTGDNLKSIPVYVFFDKDGEGLVTLRCWDIAKIPESKKTAAILACNELNNKYRWVKFYVDSDNDVCAQIDAYIDEETCGYECASLVNRVVNIVDEGYPVFMRVLWA
ncbi:MAG: YbjN domain-containing protein [Oscillospiraceae bacterium]|nr:YbjN domain-containing protein [Oscillospiraceae bacterium]